MAMTVTVEHASTHLAEMIEQLANGPIVLTRDDVPVAQLAPPDPLPQRVGVRQLGTMKGTVLYMAPDFNDTPEGFEEYM